MSSPVFTMSEVLRARARIAPYLPATPAFYFPALDALFGCRVWLKFENHQPTGAFKVRGGVNLCAILHEEEGRDVSLLAASTGNHGQSVAYGARLFGMRARIVVPEQANPDKVAAMRALGADVIFAGSNYEECKIHAETMAQEPGVRYISAGNEPLLIPGVATYALELMERAPELDAVFVPIGGGSGASGCCLAGHAINPALKVIGVQSSHAPAVYQSWKSGQLQTTSSADTFAEGLATLSAFELTIDFLRAQLDDFVLVDDQQLRAAIRLLYHHTHNVAEGAGAAALAAAWANREKFQGKSIGVIISGGNLPAGMLAEILRENEA